MFVFPLIAKSSIDNMFAPEEKAALAIFKK